MRPAVYTFIVQDLNAVAAKQVTTAAGGLVINGTYADGMQVGTSGQSATPVGGFQYAVALNCSGDMSALNFTVLGDNAYGQTVSQTLSGPNGGVVYTTTQFAKVRAVTTDAAVTVSTSIGVGGNGSSRPFTVDTFKNPVNINCDVLLTAAATLFLQSTDQNIQGATLSGLPASSLTWGNVSSISGVTASANALLTAPQRSLRFTVSGANAAGTVRGTLTQAG